MFVSAASSGDDEPPRHREPVVLKTNECLEQHAVILVPLEVSDGEDHGLTARGPEFSAHSLSVSRVLWNAVVYHRERGLSQTEIICKFFPGRVGDRDGKAGLSDGPAQRDPAP